MDSAHDEATEMAARIVATYRDVFSGDERRDPVETVSRRVARTYADVLDGDENEDSRHTRLV